MRHARRILAVALLLAGAPLGADLKLKPVHPDEPVEHTLQQRFSLGNALAGLESIRSFLDSFRRLTEAARGRISASAWKKIGHTEWDVQNLGFANLPRAVEGALRYQNYLLKQALCRLAELEAGQGKAAKDKAERARQELTAAEKEFQDFWDSLAIAD